MILNQVTSGQLAQGSGTFLIQQGVDSDGHALITTTRASPQTVREPSVISHQHFTCNQTLICQKKKMLLLKKKNNNFTINNLDLFCLFLSIAGKLFVEQESSGGGGSSTAYLVTGAQDQSPTSAAAIADNESHYSLAHATRVSPATVRHSPPLSPETKFASTLHIVLGGRAFFFSLSIIFSCLNFLKKKKFFFEKCGCRLRARRAGWASVPRSDRRPPHFSLLYSPLPKVRC